DHRMPGEELRELLQLGAGRQIPVDEEVGGLHEAAAFAQLLDRDSAVTEDAPLAVEEGDRALRRSRVHERGIERHVSGLRAEALDGDALSACGAFDYRHLQ